MQVIAPGKTSRGPSDRVKIDRKDAELLVRLLLAGSLTRVVVRPPEVEAARGLTRAHDASVAIDDRSASGVEDHVASRAGVSQVDDVGRSSIVAGFRANSSTSRPASACSLTCWWRRMGSRRKAAIALRLSELASDERW